MEQESERKMLRVINDFILLHRVATVEDLLDNAFKNASLQEKERAHEWIKEGKIKLW